MSFSSQLRQLLTHPKILVIPGVYDCLGAKLAEQSGFEASATSGFGIAASTLGVPDYGLLTATEMLNSTGKIAKSVKIPLIADLDTGYGNALNVIRTVEEAVNLGISGIILEDQEFPKKCGHFDDKRVISTSEHCSKIKAAIQARGESNLVIIARTDARAPLGLAEALARGRAYLDVGADVLFIEAPQSVTELEAIAQAFPDVPLVANMIEGGKTPELTASDLQQLGFKIVFFPLSGLLAATKAINECWHYLKENGTTVGFEPIVDFQDFKSAIDLPKYRQLEQDFRS
ncbi:Carboxyvinyl-carboxyphosphonatephosphorylmutase [Stanieria cyanosphaera PCC 7437]|uniref:Carboxyvinyl-carboxyphosphonatephosphorylmutase n=1 Tax=Stanieria cyanosphaera (strain ATCC 29371 / PCC 7437) TaxID=111780 RepID=K9XPT7_STAC7|nr:isocitrate lyase/PEP mutase family protein [Stanieria cyanosphaera]AFZ34630.1 Carboxyvinyl-carboxyphosphonatephosphorylmutase [Stanieria cyanosphaera PCC 7437]